MSSINFSMSRTLSRIAVTMMANPYRVWTASSLAAAAGCPVENYVQKFRENRLIKRSTNLSGRVEFALTEKGRRVLGDVVDQLTSIKMTGTQQIRARALARRLVDHLPEEMADRVILTRGNVIHVIDDDGSPYALTIAPR